MIKWVKRVLGITLLEREIELLRVIIDAHRTFVSQQMAELKNYTRVDADVGYRGNNTI